MREGSTSGANIDGEGKTQRGESYAELYMEDGEQGELKKWGG